MNKVAIASLLTLVATAVGGYFTGFWTSHPDILFWVTTGTGIIGHLLPSAAAPAAKQ